MNNGKNIEQLIKFATQDSDVVSVILFGSAARSEHNTQSDVDICIILKRYNYSKIFLSEKKIKIQ
jgi:predicted nucleotidyltransferase